MSNNSLILLREFLATKSCRFARLRYTNTHGETSVYDLHLNVRYLRVLKRDLAFLLKMKVSTALEVQAREELIASLRTSIETEAHNPAYTKAGYYEHITEGIKENAEGQIYVNAFVLRKTVEIPGQYKEVKSKPLTIAKNKIRKQLKAGQFREFRLDLTQIHSINMNGKTIEIL
jgi:hypothetical protein